MDSPLEFHSTKLWVNRSPWTRSFEFMLVARDVLGKPFDALPVQMREVEKEDLGKQREPTFSIDETAAQQLMDELWNCGLRPSEGTGSAGALAATQKHLEDMRKISFDLLSKKDD